MEAERVKTNSKEIEEMRKRTGSVKSCDPLVSFLYILMRDHVTPGTVEKIMEQHIGYGECIFTNGHLARLAQDVKDRLRISINIKNLAGDV